jgi:alpha-tubulin suppressor-like RCC1 family protein
VAISNGYSCMALKSDGTVWGWGWNRFGEVGNGTIGIKTEPVQASISNVVSISGGDSSYAVKSDGTVWAWGYNSSGQLNIGSTGNQSTPAQVLNINNAKIVFFPGDNAGTAAGVIKNDSTIWTWGDNNFNQLGDGTTNPRYTPAQVSGLANVGRLRNRSYGFFALANSSAGPENPPVNPIVGGEILLTNKTSILMPWLAIAGGLILAVVLILRRISHSRLFRA